MSMMTGQVSRINAGNAAFGWMQAANARMGLLSCCGGGQPSFQGLYNADKQLELDMLNDSFQYQAYNAMADSQDKVAKENIKRSFSIFA